MNDLVPNMDLGLWNAIGRKYLQKHKPFLELCAFVAAAVFFGCVVFNVVLGNVPEVDAGLFSLALGFVIDRVAL